MLNFERILMIKKVIFFSASLMINTNLFAHDEAPSANTYYTVVNDNSQKTIFERKQAETCENASGEKLVEYIFSQNIPDQRKLLAQLQPHKRKEFLRKLDIPNYKKLLDSFSENEWRQLFDSLTDYEKSHWPKTVKEQTAALDELQDSADSAHNATLLAEIGLAVFIHPVFWGIVAYEAGTAMIYNKAASEKFFLEQRFKEYLEATFEI
jgi:hypothetical protein